MNDSSVVGWNSQRKSGTGYGIVVKAVTITSLCEHRKCFDPSGLNFHRVCEFCHATRSGILIARMVWRASGSPIQYPVFSWFHDRAATVLLNDVVLPTRTAGSPGATCVRMSGTKSLVADGPQKCKGQRVNATHGFTCVVFRFST